MSNKQCRIMITKKCNLRCSYCLMKNEELMATFKPATIEEILKKEYSAYCITGGEPFYNIYTQCSALQLAVMIKETYNKPIYLYTNGTHIEPLRGWLGGHRSIELFDGINISLHRKIPYKTLVRVHRYCPVRVHRQDTKIDARLIHFCATNKMALKIWHKDDCTTVPEDRFILKEGD